MPNDEIQSAPPIDEAVAQRLAKADQLLSDLTTKVTQIDAHRAATEAAKAKAEADRDLVAQARNAAEAAKAAAETGQAQVTMIAADLNTIRATVEAERDKVAQAGASAVAALSLAEAERDKATGASAAAVAARDSILLEQQKVLQTSANVTAASNLVETEKEKVGNSRTDVELQLAEAERFALAAKEAAARAAEESLGAASAHNLSTTAGLAGAFNTKARQNRWREIIWGLVLAASLVTAGVIGYFRFRDISAIIATTPETPALLAELILAIFGVSAPVWMAWVATRMLSKNLALTEDYAYKASLAQAYVGFRDQARDLDPVLEQRLFAAAVTQLDANPVRLLDGRHPGSPLQDLLQQPFMIEALKDPRAKEGLLKWFKERFKSSAYKLDAS